MIHLVSLVQKFVSYNKFYLTELLLLGDTIGKNKIKKNWLQCLRHSVFYLAKKSIKEKEIMLSHKSLFYLVYFGVYYATFILCFSNGSYYAGGGVILMLMPLWSVADDAWNCLQLVSSGEYCGWWGPSTEDI
jgi:hypothetical protein